MALPESIRSLCQELRFATEVNSVLVWKKEKQLPHKRPICVGYLCDILWNLNNYSCATKSGTCQINPVGQQKFLN